MSNTFQLLDVQDARDYLSGFDAHTRRKGEAYFQQGRVREMVVEVPGQLYTARVQGSSLYDVTVSYDEEEGWGATCSCPLETDCKHTYAAMKALLAEHSVAEVRGLSSGTIPKSTLTPARASHQPSGTVGALLSAAVGRALRSTEQKFVRQLSEIYRRCSMTRQISTWDLQQLGLYLRDSTPYGWGGLKIWPSFPETEHEFWLYIAHAAREQHCQIPDFMQPVTDLAPIEAKLAKWRRAEYVKRWKDLLGGFVPVVEQAVSSKCLEGDLRLVVHETSADLEWRRTAEEPFASLKPAQFRQLIQDRLDGRVVLPAPAELISQIFEHHLIYTPSTTSLTYSLPNALTVLGRILQMPALESRVVDQNGAPLRHATEPLRWDMTPAQTDQEDYRLRLVQSDGTPAPPVLCAIPGHPPLYLSWSVVFPGPPQQQGLLDPLHENAIPAPALEGAAGLRFLHSLRVELPPRLRERIIEVPLKVSIHCGLTALYPGSQTEQCGFQVVAHSSDRQHEETWTGRSWLEAKKPIQGRGRHAQEEKLVVYERSALAAVPPLLEPLGLKPDLYTSRLAMRVTKKFPEIFAEWLKSVPPSIEVQLDGDLASFASAAVSGRVRLEAKEAEIDWFDLQVVLDVSDTTLSPEEIKLLLNAKGKFVRLGKKGWRRLQFDLTEEEDERLARLGLNPHELTAEPQRLHALQLADESAKRFLPAQQVEQIQRRASEIKARVTPDLPVGVKAQLRPYQLEGYHFLSYLATNRFGGILADDMGLGKTLQALAWLLWLRQPNGCVRPLKNITASSAPAEIPAHAPAARGAGSGEEGLVAGGSPDLLPAGAGGFQPPVPAAATPSAPPPQTGATSMLPSLVVCPKSVMDNWHAEAARFAPELRVKSWPAAQLEHFTERLDEADLHVINYSQLRALGESLLPIKWLALILDEGQCIKNPSSQTAQVARALPAQNRLVLSGTPIENRLLDLWSLMAFAMPGVLGSRQQFAKLYDAKGDPFARRRLAARVRPFLLRRTKSQVARDLPDRIEEDLFCEIEGEQKTLYRAELKRAQQMLLRIQTQKQLAQERFHFLVSLLRLRQICCHPALVQGGSRTADPKTAGAKIEALLEQLEPLMEEGQKVLIFSQFVEMLRLLKPFLQARQWPIFYLAGDTENRGELVKTFQETEGPAAFLISLKAGGFGLNLTAASYVVLFDPWWNPAVENQAIDRTHRIGQTNKVIAYRLLIKDSIEEKIRHLQKQKKALVDDVLGEEKFAQSLTMEDLQFLFAD